MVNNPHTPPPPVKRKCRGYAPCNKSQADFPWQFNLCCFVTVVFAVLLQTWRRSFMKTLFNLSVPTATVTIQKPPRFNGSGHFVRFLTSAHSSWALVLTTAPSRRNDQETGDCHVAKPVVSSAGICYLIFEQHWIQTRPLFLFLGVIIPHSLDFLIILPATPPSAFFTGFFSSA